MHLSLVHLTTLVTAVQCGSMTAAAGVLCYSLSTVSGHVARLEKDLRAPLLQRSTTRMVPTPEGLRVAQVACRILSLHSEIVDNEGSRVDAERPDVTLPTEVASRSRWRYYLAMSIDWSSEVSRGALSHGVLAALAQRARHGYELVGVLRDAGFERLQGGTLYPLLRRMEGQGLVSHAWETPAAGPARKVFALSERGRSELQEARAAWDEMSRSLERLMTTAEERQ